MEIDPGSNHYKDIFWNPTWTCSICAKWQSRRSDHGRMKWRSICLSPLCILHGVGNPVILTPTWADRSGFDPLRQAASASGHPQYKRPPWAMWYPHVETSSSPSSCSSIPHQAALPWVHPHLPRPRCSGLCCPSVGMPSSLLCLVWTLAPTPMAPSPLPIQCRHLHHLLGLWRHRDFSPSPAPTTSMDAHLASYPWIIQEEMKTWAEKEQIPSS